MSMPSRPRSHDLSTLSEKQLRAVLPAEWVLTKPDSDYGVDFDVEVFSDGLATGIHFYIQLKGTDSASGKVKLETSTLNYWGELDIPTLVVQYSTVAEELRWQWAYLLEFASNAEAKTRTVALPEIWSSTTPNDLVDELKGRRATKNIYANLPIYYEVHGSAEFLGDAAGLVRGGASRISQIHPMVTSRKAKATPLRFEIALHENRVDIRLRGLPFHHLTYDGLHSLAREEVADVVIADIEMSMALHMSRIGLVDIGGTFAAHSVGKSSMTLKPSTCAELTTLFIRTRRYDELLILIERTFSEEESVNKTTIILTLKQAGLDMTIEQMRLVANAISGGSASEATNAIDVYNAGNLLHKRDFANARVFYERAAELNPDYKNRGYWWSEQGGTFFLEGDLESAKKYYERALDLDHERSRPLLADVLLRLGQYKRSLVEFRTSFANPHTGEHQWRLTEFAFGYVTGFLGLDEQVRDPDLARTLTEAEDLTTKEGLLAVFEADLLTWFALWVSTNIEREEGRPALPFVLAAALVELDIPVLWEEALRMAWNQAPELVPDIILCIKQFCRDEFLAFINEDNFLDKENVDNLTLLILESPDAEDPNFELRDREGRTPDETPEEA